MKFFKLGLILSAVALTGTSILAEETQREKFERPSALAEMKTYLLQGGPLHSGHIYDPSEEYEKLQKEALRDLNIQDNVQIRNSSVANAFAEVFNRFMPLSTGVPKCTIVDEHKLSNAPIGAKRFVVYHHLEQWALYNNEDNNLQKNILEQGNLNNLATSDRLMRELEVKAAITACSTLKCEQCCLEFANFIDPKFLYPSSGISPSSHHLTPQEIRELAKQHNGKTCKYHTPAFDPEEEAVELFKQATNITHLKTMLAPKTHLNAFMAVVTDIEKVPKNAFNYEIQYKKLTAAIRHRFGANPIAILKFLQKIK